MQSSMHEDFNRKERVDGPSDRSFGVTLGLFFLIVAILPLLHSRPPRWWSALIAAVLLILAVASPHLLQVPNRLWMKLALLLSRITNPIITALMFYLLFTPAALICRLTGQDLLRLKIDPLADSYWIPRQPVGPAPETMRNQF
jgi:Saxitoxin biosynthesis operon protein SxtJ